MALTERVDGYSAVSIGLHWLAAVGIVALFLTHEGRRGDAAYAFHVGAGAIIGVLLLWRVVHRFFHGMAEKPDQPFLLNLLSSLVLWGFIVATVVVVVTGYLLPWSVGQPLDIFGVVSIPPLVSISHGAHEVLEEAHEIAGDAFLPLLALHLIGVAKHAFFDRDGTARRIVRPVPGGH